MKEFEVYFEIYGKKMKAVVEARDPQDARRIVQGKIVWHKVVEVPPEDPVDHLKKMFGFS